MSNRRTFLKQAAAIPFAPALAAAPKQPAARSYSEEMPDMILAFLEKRTNALAAEWDARRAGIRTPAALIERNRFVRAQCVQMVRGLPDRTPLDPTIVRVHQRSGYRIEVLMFESRPDFWVTASLYLPESGKAPYPAIISPCGHYATARLDPTFQSMYLGLVKEGFVVLAYDPIGQGERRYYWNPATNQNEIGGPVTWEHSLPGQLMMLVGENLTQIRIWDGMRAIDYLLSRPEVDGQRIGCCGHSGGGLFTTFLAALDERIACAAAHESGMHPRWPVHIRPETAMGTGDTEQHFFPAAIYGVDSVDINAAIAPRPLLSTIEHFGSAYDTAAAQVRARYELLGAAEKFHTVQAVDPHDMTMRLRLANTNWFCRWLQNRPGPEVEPEFQLETAADMNCMPNGSLRYSHRGHTLYAMVREKVKADPPDAGLPPAELRSRLQSLLRYRKPDSPLAPRLVATTPRPHYRIEKLEFLSEPGISIPTWVFVPEQAGSDRSAILFVSDRGKEADGLEFGVLEQLTRRGHIVVSVDVRGIGETRPRHAEGGSSGMYRHVGDAETTMQFMAWEMDESLLGMRVADVVRSVDFALSRSDVDRTRLRAIGQGMGALWVLFAACLDERIHAVVCEGGLISYAALASSDRYLQGASIMIPDVLLHFDLADVAAAIAGRRLALLSPLDAMKAPVPAEETRKAYNRTAAAYSRSHASGNFTIAEHHPETPLAQQYLELLG